MSEAEDWIQRKHLMCNNPQQNEHVNLPFKDAVCTLSVSLHIHFLDLSPCYL